MPVVNMIDFERLIESLNTVAKSYKHLSRIPTDMTSPLENINKSFANAR